MKKNIIFLLLLFISTTVFAFDRGNDRDFRGISENIVLGMDSERAKGWMEYDGWTLTKESKDSLTYKKDDGEYANVEVESIAFEFTNDMLTSIAILFKKGRSNSEKAWALFNGVSTRPFLFCLEQETKNGSMIEIDISRRSYNLIYLMYTNFNDGKNAQFLFKLIASEDELKEKLKKKIDAFDRS